MTGRRSAAKRACGPATKQGHLERPGDRPVLRHEFADDHLDGGGQQHPDDDRDTGHGARGQSGGGEGGASSWARAGSASMPTTRR